MDINENLKALLKNSSLRERNWMRGYLKIKIKKNNNNSDLYQKLRTFSRQAINDMTMSMNEHLIDEHYFSWLKTDDLFALAWVYFNLDTPNNLLPGQPDYPNRFIELIPIRKIHFKNLRDYLIVIFDKWAPRAGIGAENEPIDTDTKERKAEKLKREWLNFRESSRKDWGWIDPKDSTQLNWIWNRLKKTEMLYFTSPPESEKVKYQLICAMLSLQGPMFDRHEDSKNLYVIQTKKYWSQKKYRDSNSDYKPGYAPMTESTKRKLKAIASRRNEKIQYILEDLINCEHERICKK